MKLIHEKEVKRIMSLTIHNRQQEILKNIRLYQNMTDLDAFSAAGSMDDNKLLRTVFVNYRKNNEKGCGLRLSYFGLSLLIELMDHWTNTYQENVLLYPKDLLFIDRIFRMPFYFDKSTIILFEPQLAMRLKLCNDYSTFRDSFLQESY